MDKIPCFICQCSTCAKDECKEMMCNDCTGPVKSCNGHKESLSVRQHQTGQAEIIFNASIPYGEEPEKLATRYERYVPMIIDFFVGTNAAFKLYLNAQKILLSTGVIVP